MQKNNKKENTEYTINFDETVKRVFVGTDEHIDQYIYNEFLNLTKLRNALTHNEIILKIEPVELIVVTLTPIVTIILQKNLVGSEKKKFNNFVTSKKYKKILQQLIGNNAVWRIITISNLLELYSKKDYDSLLKNEIKDLESTLSTLNIIVKKDDILCNINDEYYITYISYLKQEICDLLINNLEMIKENTRIINVIRRTKTIEKIVEEYLIKAVIYVYSLLNDQQFISFERKETINEI